MSLDNSTGKLYDSKDEKLYGDSLPNSDDNLSADAILQKELAQEENHDIKYRSCSWQKTAGLLFSEYICLAILSFPWSYSVLGLVPGLIITVAVALSTLYTGLIIGEYCAKYPSIQSVCDIGQHLFWGKKWAWYATAACFICNNTLIQGLHVLVGAKYLNTVSHHGACTIAFAVVAAIICLIFSLPRTFSHMSWIGVFSAVTQFVAVLLCIIFAGTQQYPDKYDGTPVVWHVWPAKGTTYVAGMSATLNIIYTFVGQICYPSFIAEMKNPKEFKKALYVVTLAEIIVFALAGAVVYVYVGDAYVTAPAFGSISGTNKIIAFSFAIPTIVFLGSLYGNVTSQFIFFKIFKEDSKHRYSHTVKGWGIWIGINVVTWILAFIVAEVIPFFSDLLSLMSSLFDCWFGFVFWGMAFFKLKKSKYAGQFTGEFGFFKILTFWEKVEYFICYGLIIIGLYILGPGLYASVDSIVLSYESGLYGHPFSCASNGI